MSALTINLDPAQLRERYERAERRREEAAEAERAAYLHWQEAYGGYEIARDEACSVWRAWVEAIAP